MKFKAPSLSLRATPHSHARVGEGAYLICGGKQAFNSKCIDTSLYDVHNRRLFLYTFQARIKLVASGWGASKDTKYDRNISLLISNIITRDNDP